MKLIDFFKNRWNIESNFQFIMIMITFAVTGFTVVFAKELVFGWLGITPEMNWWLRALIWLVTILPLYNVLLIMYGTLLGQKDFFVWFLKKSLGRLLPSKKEKVTSEP